MVNELRRRLPYLLLLALLPACGSTLAESPEELFLRGNAAYEDGRYGDAVEAYRGLLRYQFEDAVLEYNLANAEFRLGRLGPAIVHYERAVRLDPTDADIRNNLSFARTFCVDRVEPVPQPAAVRWFRDMQNSLGPDRQAWGALVLIWAIAAVVAWCFARPGGWSGAYGWVLAGLLLLLVLVCASWFATYERLEGKPLAVVVSDVVEVLAGPGQNNATLFTIHEGLTVEVRTERTDWLQVSLPDGRGSGWIPRRAVEIV